jgi:signal transduction histidine kinase
MVFQSMREQYLISPIRRYFEVREDWAPRMDPKAREYFEHICANAARMGQMINDLLTFARLGQKHLSKTQIDMQALTQLVLQASHHPTTWGPCLGGSQARYRRHVFLRSPSRGPE